MNLLLNIPVTLAMLFGQSNFVHPIHLAQTGHQAYYQQVSSLAFKVLKVCALLVHERQVWQMKIL